MLTRVLKVPLVTPATISELEGELPQYITRHFNKDFVVPDVEKPLKELTLSGSYLFGTIFGYRPADTTQDGRLGDFQEGLQREVFMSRTGMYNISDGGYSISSTRVNGFEDPVAVEYAVNDYCSCASHGKFSRERALRLRASKNPDVNYYVVYDLKKLKNALQKMLQDDLETKDLSILIRNVVYGEKDRVWEAESEFHRQSDKDHLGFWLGNSFVKSENYKHEEEVRILIFDAQKAGRLPNKAKPMSWHDEGIADAIEDHGCF